MHHSSLEAGKQLVIDAMVKRADGSVSQVLIVDHEGIQHAIGYWAPGTKEPTWEELKYHWADAFTDEQLLENYPEYCPVENLREESRISNETQTFTHRSPKP